MALISKFAGMSLPLLLLRSVLGMMADGDTIWLPETFDWTSVKPSEKLVYHQCYEDFECARLNVPLDWSNVSNPNVVSIALARLPAVVDAQDDSFGGSILLNPGGPSGSGIDLLRWAGKGIQEIVDGDKHFEIVSFDPRGTKYTTPSAACFDDDHARELIGLLGLGAGTVDSSWIALNTHWTIAEALGELCDQTENGIYPDGHNIRQFVSTALVARDMVEMIDRIDQHLQELTGGSGRRKQQSVLAPGSHSDDVPLLNYWGYSYGTYLGNTFASLHPDRVGRMILDGVVDAPDYAATGWTTNLLDTNKTWALFFEYCFEAGPKCALFKPSLSGPLDIQLQVEAFLEDLKENPIPLVLCGNAFLLTYAQLIVQIHGALYGPNQVWANLAIGLSGLLERNATRAAPQFLPKDVYRSRAENVGGRSLLDPFNNRSLPYPPSYPHALEASVSILCGDGNDITASSKTDYAAYVDQLLHQSPLTGSVWAEGILSCIHWPASQRPAERNRFTGPFSSKLSDYNVRASPLLFIGNTADNVTPVRNAFKMSKLHEGSRVLVQNTPGHCSGINNPSQCTFNAIKNFFARGILPEDGLVCEGDRRPWDGD